jgi:hypothetical protein
MRTPANPRPRPWHPSPHPPPSPSHPSVSSMSALEQITADHNLHEIPALVGITASSAAAAVEQQSLQGGESSQL